MPQVHRDAETARKNANAWYTVPNVNIPHNKRDPGKVAQVAIDQLKPYQDAAKAWPVEFLIRDSRECNVCGVCHQNLWFESDREERPYLHSPEETMSLTVAHIRQRHSGVVDG